MVQRWLAMAQTAKDSGVIDGLFVDCGRPVGLCALPPAKSAAWYAGHEQLMQSMQQIFTNPDGSKGPAPAPVPALWLASSDADRLAAQV